MTVRTVAHLSDLHLGRSRRDLVAAERLCASLLDAEVDHVIVTGDITHRGGFRELLLFQTTFAPLLARGRVTVVPGNHDRVGDDIGAHVMNGRSVAIERRPGLFVVRLDTTARHNRSFIAAHGRVTAQALRELDAALGHARPDELVVLAMHHHALPIPDETWADKLSTWVGLPFARELAAGPQLLRSAFGRCDLLLHGHRHHARALELAVKGGRSLGVFNAGSSVELAGYRLFRHLEGRRLGEPTWISTAEPAPIAWSSLLPASTGLAAMP